MQPCGIRGFTVLEAIIALAIVTAGIVSLAGLAHQVTDTVARSRRQLSAAVMADAFVAAHGTHPLAATPPDCLDRDIAGCTETLDDAGRPTSGAAVYVRRWRIATVAGAPAAAWTLTVCVVPVGLRQRATPSSSACVARILAEPVP